MSQWNQGHWKCDSSSIEINVFYYDNNKTENIGFSSLEKKLRSFPYNWSKLSQKRNMTLRWKIKGKPFCCHRCRFCCYYDWQIVYFNWFNRQMRTETREKHFQPCCFLVVNSKRILENDKHRCSFFNGKCHFNVFFSCIIFFLISSTFFFQCISMKRQMINNHET